jgi:multimeric flavodoxin WrbA
MKVLGLSGSMRKDGNTAHLIKLVLERCDSEGIKTEFVSLAGKKIHPCLGCEKCKKTKWCVIENDDWGAVMKKVLACEVLIIGSPTYYYDVCGHLKNFMDRTYSLYHDRTLGGKKAAIVIVNATSGGARAQETLEAFLGAHEFSYLGSVIGKGYHEGEVMNDPGALEGAEEIARKIRSLAKL